MKKTPKYSWKTIQSLEKGVEQGENEKIETTERN